MELVGEGKRRARDSMDKLTACGMGGVSVVDIPLAGQPRTVLQSCDVTRIASYGLETPLVIKRPGNESLLMWNYALGSSSTQLTGSIFIVLTIRRAYSTIALPPRRSTEVHGPARGLMLPEFSSCGHR
jgi:hypothetical protein